MDDATRRPNVLVVMSDEQRWDSLGCNGNRAARTPHLDALAASGAALDHCQATYPLCCPSRMSLWTGLMPHDHHGFGNWRWLREDLRDAGLVQPFARAGYHTIYNGKWHVPGTTPARMGFADVEATPAVLSGLDRGRYIEPYRAYAAAQGYDLLPDHIENITASDLAQLDDPDTAHYGTAEIALEHFLEPWQTRRFLEQLARRPEDSPFFAAISYNAPHFPMIVPEPYDRLIDPDAFEPSLNFLAGLEGKPREVVDSTYHVTGWSEGEWRRLIAHYLGLCALIDDQVGQILGWLDINGLRENTIVVFTSDHGDMLGSHGLNKKGYPLHYDEALRVPMVVAGPGVAPGHRAGQLVSLMDLLPTLGDLAGVDIGGDHDGVSFAPALAGEAAWSGRDHLVAESLLVDGREGGTGEAVDPRAFDPARDGINLSVRTPSRRYIWRLHDHDELYDLEADPFELDNIAGSPAHRGEIERFRRLLAAEIEATFPAVAAHIRASPGSLPDSREQREGRMSKAGNA
jgi:arylsulfatase A-like enzyme